MSQYEINHNEFISLNFYFTVWSYIVAMRTLLNLKEQMKMLGWVHSF